MKKLLAALGLLALSTIGVHAQSISAVVVSACGTPPHSYAAGTFQPVLMDTTGTLCTYGSGGGGGGGGGSVTQGTIPWVVDTTTGVGSNLWTAVTSAIPAGTNVIGSVSQNTSPWVVDTSNSGNLYNAIIGPVPAGSNTIGYVGQVAATTTTTTLQNAAVANGNGTAQVVTGYSGAVLTVNCSACSGGTQINFQGSQDGTNFSSIYAVQIGTVNTATSTTTAGLTYWRVAVAGLTDLRATVSAYSAGTVTITSQTTPLSYDAPVQPTAEQTGSAYPNKANFLSGSGSQTGTTITTIITAPSAGKVYVTDVQCGRTDAGSSSDYVTFNDAAATIMVLPNSGGGGGNNMHFTTPLTVAATTAFRFTPNAGVSTIYCSAQGYNAT